MATERDIQQSVVSFLIAKGYPESAIAPEYSIGSKSTSRGRRLDIAVLDPRERELLALIEVKRDGTARSLDEGAIMLAMYSKAVAGASVPAYLFAAIDAPEIHFRIYVLDANGSLKELSEAEFPTFETLKGRLVAARKNELQVATQVTVDHLWWGCLFLAIIAFLLLIADIWLGFHGKNVITRDRIALLGIILALIVIPYATKLKVLGIEFERYVGDRPKPGSKDKEHP